MSIWACMCVCARASVHVCACTHVCAHMRACVCVCMWERERERVHACVCARTCVSVCVRTCVRVCVKWRSTTGSTKPNRNLLTQGQLWMAQQFVSSKQWYIQAKFTNKRHFAQFHLTPSTIVACWRLQFYLRSWQTCFMLLAQQARMLAVLFAQQDFQAP